MKVLSFVIPAYNSQAFLDKCVGSMLSPEVLDKLEVVIVNDGSTDDTAWIAEGYCTRYPGVVRLISQENRGHGGALNTGCAAARGKYLKAVDADDWVETENLPEFVRLLERCGSDVVLTHYRTIDIGTGEVRNWRSYPEEFGREYGFAAVMSAWRSFDRSLTYHGITYRTEFYQAHSTPLPEQVFYEDHEYAAFPCCRADGVLSLDLFIYDYRVGDVNQSVSSENQLRRIGHTETVIRRMSEEYGTLPENAGKRYAAMKIKGLVLSFLTTALLADPDRKGGRAQARRVIAGCRAGAPEVYGLVRWKYRVFCLMNYLHLGKSAWDRILRSKLYNRVLGKHTFE